MSTSSASVPIGCRREGLVIFDTSNDEGAFYNPAQVFNRDLSIVAIKAFGKLAERQMQQKILEAKARADQEGRTPPAPLKFVGMNILEPLAASGLRSLRYLKELPDLVSHVITNDLDETAARHIVSNCELNNISRDKLTVFCSDAAFLMYTLPHLQHFLHASSPKISFLPCGSRWNSPFQPPLASLSNDGVTTSSMLDGEEDTASCKALNRASSLHKLFKRRCFSAFLSALQPPCPPSRESATDASSEVYQKEFPSAEQSNGVHAPTTIPEASSDWNLPPLMFDIIDIDPYGSVSPFLDSAVQAIRSEGLLCLTSTDMPVLCGNTPEVAFYKYGGFPTKARYTHEISLRLLMHAVSMSAAKYKRSVIPLACISCDFYVRLFVKIVKCASGCKKIPTNTAMAYQCVSCDSFHVIPMGTINRRNENAFVKYKASQLPVNVGSQCKECGAPFTLVGPFYSGPLYDQEFLDECLSICQIAPVELPGLSLTPKIKGLLNAMREELPDVPLYYHLPTLFHRVKLSMIKPIRFKSALHRLNYRVSHFHREPQGLKTDAPNHVIFDILRKYAMENPPKNADKFPLLCKKIETENIDFEVVPFLEKLENSREARWFPNPEPFWGPKPKAKTKREAADDLEKNSNRKKYATDISVESSVILPQNPLL
ncbi:putative tRna (guanine(26)-N(2))-dimethyltransferase [Cardiosporidium cionae]|uniref:tRNA (guanine(26)-N(2))-dimethyltransferase n=1 Tax=Cardiosporidium cionae TaxID=476202 RepID=A0ABQ7JFN5_9APIC|nr:putative tRna (guanine(26)-N(2))-dimethyltransferase [Cardiosporidium cionae]|eukprot:KAF8822808.1 putative tRna (guanine(26)-N(2))-dimethyltransferase [Cardiosporidium cionae]